MASTSPFEHADSAAPGRRGHGSRAARRASAKRETPRRKGEAVLSGFPKWDGLKHVLLFLIAPIMLVFAIVVTGGDWEPEVLYPIAMLIAAYVFFTALKGVELVLACALFYLPFSTTYVVPLAPGVNGTNMLLLLGLFATVMRAADKREGWVAWPPGTAVVFLFAVLSTLSGVTVSFTLPGGYSNLMGEVLSFKAWIDQFLLYFIALSCIRDVETAKRMVVYMAIGSMVLVLYSVPEMLNKMGRSSIEQSRIMGPHQQSNNFGGFVAYTLMPVLAFFTVNIKDFRAWLLTPYFLIAAKVLISTFSRGAYLALALGGLCAGFFKGKGFLAFWAAMALSFFLVFPQFLPDAVLVRLSSITEQTASTSNEAELDKSSENRLILWRAAGKMILEDPFLGKGFKAFPKLKSQYTDSPVKESDPHNMYLYIASQMGLPVLSLFLLLLGYSFWLGRRLSKHETDRFIRVIGIGGAAGTACYAAICMFGSRAVNLEFTSYFWVYFVVMQVIHKIERESIMGDKPRKRRANAFTATKHAEEDGEGDQPQPVGRALLAPAGSRRAAGPRGLRTREPRRSR